MTDKEYPELVQCYLDYHRFRIDSKRTGVIDLSNATFFYPSMLLPLMYFRQNTLPAPKMNMPEDYGAANYLKKAMGQNSWKTGIPSLEITRKTEEVEKRLNDFFDRHFEHGEKCGGENAFKLLVGELVDNVHDHSDFSKAYIQGQMYKNKGFTELCILDNGKTIPGAFREHNKPFDKDSDAIIQAICGVTTKKEGERGTGLGFVFNLVTKGLFGEIFVSSGEGFLYLGKHSKILVFNDESIYYRGTIVAFRIPYIAKKVDVFDFINTRPNLEKLLGSNK